MDSSARPSVLHSRRVLHVIESFGGGSANAMQEFVEATPDFEHHLLRATRAGEYVPTDTTGRFASVRELPAGVLPRLRAVRSAVREVQPDVIHAHSSFAGLYVRTSVRSTSRRRIVYSPHCFAFFRGDLKFPPRALIAVIETALALNTDRIAACSSGERRVATWMPSRRRAVHVPNTPRAVSSKRGAERSAGDARVVSSGRLGLQKDPAAFLQVVENARSLLPGLRATWIGDGDPGLRESLVRSGVTVTGWIPKDDVAAALAAADVYLHTAAWEGFPLAVLEAAAAEVPIVARRISAFDGMPRAWLFSSPAEGATLIAEAASGRRAENVEAWGRALAHNTVADQRAALLRVYGDG